MTENTASSAVPPVTVQCAYTVLHENTDMVATVQNVFGAAPQDLVECVFTARRENMSGDSNLTAHCRFLRLVEFFALYFGVPVFLTFFLKPGLIIPFLWIMGLVVSIFLLRSRNFNNSSFYSFSGIKNCICLVLIRFLAAAVVLSVILIVHRPEWFLQFPKNKPLVWLVVMIAYPLLSVYPQGIVFRALYSFRYYGIWSSKNAAIVFGALAFCAAHLPFRNPCALGFTFLGGLMFLSTYDKTKSIPISCIEHALYGDLLFTIGWGVYIFHGGTASLVH